MLSFNHDLSHSVNEIFLNQKVQIIKFITSVKDMKTVGSSKDDIPPEKRIVESDVRGIIKDSVSTVIGSNQFSLDRLDEWCNAVVKKCLVHLAEARKPFRYITICNLAQKGVGMHGFSCTKWDEGTDGKISVLWSNDTIQVVVTVFWLSL